MWFEMTGRPSANGDTAIIATVRCAGCSLKATWRDTVKPENSHPSVAGQDIERRFYRANWTTTGGGALCPACTDRARRGIAHPKGPGSGEKISGKPAGYGNDHVKALTGRY